LGRRERKKGTYRKCEKFIKRKKARIVILRRGRKIIFNWGSSKEGTETSRVKKERMKRMGRGVKGKKNGSEGKGARALTERGEYRILPAGEEKLRRRGKRLPLRMEL